MTWAALGVGGSGPVAERFVDQALRAIDAHPRVALIEESGHYDNPALGARAPFRFVNAVALVETVLAPEALLGELFAIERYLGRVRSERWGPRSIDLDLLWMEGVHRKSARLTVPHARMYERAFVLEPLVEVLERAGVAVPLSMRRASARVRMGARLGKARAPGKGAPARLA